MKKYSTEQHDYVLGAANDRERLTLQHDIFKPVVVQNFTKALDEYNLALELDAAQHGTREKVQMLDVGCGEGLFLHDLAALLEERGYLEAAQLTGIDSDTVALITAEEFSRQSIPPRPELEFFAHDVTKPLSECQGLKLEGIGKDGFDFIYANVVLAHLPNAKECLRHLYEGLAPGGVIYVRDAISLTEGNDGWIAPHPALVPYLRLFFSFIARNNPGLEVALETTDWLKELGAEEIKAEREISLVGGNTKQGLQWLRNTVMVVRNSSPMLVARGFVTQAQVNELMQTLFRELGQDARGQSTFINTLARKPRRF